MKRLISLLLCMLLLLGIAASPALASSDVVSAPDAENGIYYVDDAQCLSDDTKDYIDEGNLALTEACGGQVAVVTLQFLNDLNCEEYAYEVMNDWGVGDSSKNNGTVFVLVTAEKKCWVTSGSGIEDDLSAGRLEKILEENCYDSLDAGEYDQAVYDTVSAIFSWYEDYYNVSLTDYDGSGTYDAGDDEEMASPAEGSSFGFFGRLFGGIWSFIRGLLSMSIIVIIIIIFVIASIFRGPRGPRGGGWFWGGPRGPRGPRGPMGPGGFGGGDRGRGPGGGFGRGGFGGGSNHGGGFGGGGFGGGSHGGGFGGGGFGGGGGHGGGAGRR